MLISIVDGCSSGSFEPKYGLRILSLIPLSRNCANLWRKLYHIKDFIHCHFKRILTKTLQLWLYEVKRKKQRLINHVDDIVTVRYVKALSLGLRKSSITSNCQAESLNRKFQNMNNGIESAIHSLTYSKLWQCHKMLIRRPKYNIVIFWGALDLSSNFSSRVLSFSIL
jgi:hypothetical protein